MLRQDFFLHNGSYSWISIRKLLSFLGSFDLFPINRRLSTQNSHTLVWRNLLIDRTDKWKKLFIERRRATHRLSGVPPHLTNFRKWHVLSGNVTVQNGLVERIAALDCNVVHFLWKRWIADQQENEII